MKLEVRSVSECTVEEFIFLFGVSPTPTVKTLPHIFNNLTLPRKEVTLAQTTKERRPFPHCQLTSTFLVPELGAEPHQLQHKASEMARTESGSGQGKVSCWATSWHHSRINEAGFQRAAQ